MKKLLMIVSLGLTAGCMFNPCEDVQIQVIRMYDNSILPPNPMRNYTDCTMLKSEPYHAYVKYGLASAIETWECKC